MIYTKSIMQSLEVSDRFDKCQFRIWYWSGKIRTIINKHVEGACREQYELFR